MQTYLPLNDGLKEPTGECPVGDRGWIAFVEQHGDWLLFERSDGERVLIDRVGNVIGFLS